MAGAAVVVLAATAAVLAPWLSRHDPLEQDLAQVLSPPSVEYWLGTDELGRDTLSRILYGARVSLIVGLISVGIAAGIGTSIGLATGFWGGMIDRLGTIIMDALLAIPSLVLALAIAAALGPGIGNAMIAIGIIYIPHFGRLARAQVLSVRERDFVEAARALGATSWRILGRHVLRNIVSPIMVLASLNISFAILWEASLSFLGVGVQPPTPSWGSMLRTAYTSMELSPWAAIFPGLAIFLAVLGFTFLGDGIQELLDPHATPRHGRWRTREAK